MANVKLDRREIESGLPRVCMCCGVEAVTEHRRYFSWHPPMLALLILAGLLPYLIVLSTYTKKMVVNAPLCRDHQNHWSTRNLIIWGGLVGLIALVVLSIVVSDKLNSTGRHESEGAITGIICVGMIVFGIVWLIIVCIVQSAAIKPVEITDTTITLTRVSPAFIDALDRNKVELDPDKDDEDSRPFRKRRRRP